jgi:serine/threonine protein kinase
MSGPGSPSSAEAHNLARDLLAARRSAFDGERTPLDPGAVVDRFVVLRQLGRGGMGIIYLAHDPELDRKVALKLLAPQAAAGSDEVQTHLLREAQALARLSHPNVVAVYDVGTHAGGVWIAMEFVAGQTLRSWGAQPRHWSELLRVLIDAARGVAAAHAAGLIHRDLKPDNVMIGGDGRVRVMDFGLAHGRGSASDSSLTPTLTSGVDDTPTGPTPSRTATGRDPGDPRPTWRRSNGAGERLSRPPTSSGGA